jgi:hypothetical protein
VVLEAVLERVPQAEAATTAEGAAWRAAEAARHWRSAHEGTMTELIRFVDANGVDRSLLRSTYLNGFEPATPDDLRRAGWVPEEAKSQLSKVIGSRDYIIGELTRERDRLREALERIAHEVDHLGMNQSFSYCNKIARAALAPEPDHA